MIKNLMTAKGMWEQIKKDATTKSTLFFIDAEDQLSSMHLTESNDPQSHLNNFKQHFELMMKHNDNLMEMGVVICSGICNRSSGLGVIKTIKQVSAPQWHNHLVYIKSTC